MIPCSTSSLRTPQTSDLRSFTARRTLSQGSGSPCSWSYLRLCWLCLVLSASLGWSFGSLLRGMSLWDVRIVAARRA